MVTTRSGLVIGLAIPALLCVSACGGTGVAASPPQSLSAAHKEMPGTYIPPKGGPVASKTAPVVIPSSPPFVMPNSGVIAMHQGPFGEVDFTVQNFWQGYVGSVWTLVYAGGDRSGRSLAAAVPAIRVYTESFGPSGPTALSSVGTYKDPTADGLLSVVTVSGTLMRLATASGDTVTFNLGARAFQ